MSASAYFFKSFILKLQHFFVIPHNLYPFLCAGGFIVSEIIYFTYYNIRTGKENGNENVNTDKTLLRSRRVAQPYDTG